ncbi:hypothetical protein N7516_008352 [Penicillium verrucosum]|uniref:uncharacterized protein n=1 Tax=Penicillium verrucosum TaxID=60171 RepID=UPI002544EDAE|nr:uncharacterized protein N7516_008352 [Penicillium verrucosum]KAJ5926579.1 hypothetical protein N7516_008352 [Penicillium verrucosum]
MWKSQCAILIQMRTIRIGLRHFLFKTKAARQTGVVVTRAHKHQSISLCSYVTPEENDDDGRKGLVAINLGVEDDGTTSPSIATKAGEGLHREGKREREKCEIEGGR